MLDIRLDPLVSADISGVKTLTREAGGMGPGLGKESETVSVVLPPLHHSRRCAD